MDAVFTKGFDWYFQKSKRAFHFSHFHTLKPKLNIILYEDYKCYFEQGFAVKIWWVENGKG